jgi:hypothetical protein
VSGAGDFGLFATALVKMAEWPVIGGVAHALLNRMGVETGPSVHRMPAAERADPLFDDAALSKDRMQLAELPDAQLTMDIASAEAGIEPTVREQGRDPDDLGDDLLTWADWDADLDLAARMAERDSDRTGPYWETEWENARENDDDELGL